MLFVFAFAVEFDFDFVVEFDFDLVVDVGAPSFAGFAKGGSL